MSEVTIKGNRAGILLVLPDEPDWEAVCAQLEDKLAAASALIQGASAQIDVGGRAIAEPDLKKLVGYLTDTYQMQPVGLVATELTAQAAARACGLELVVPERPAPRPAAEPVAAPAPAASPGNNALYMRQTLRSGQSIRHDGHVVLWGDVNPGAEIVATGDIVVFGTLRGLAHAGAAGDASCQIMALALKPTQVRIAGFIARAPDAAGPGAKVPEVARVQDSEIHITPLRDSSGAYGGTP